MEKLTQANKILDLLQDGKKHCLTNEMFMKDDRTRISELRKKGQLFNEGAGWCDDTTHRHVSRVKLRQIIVADASEKVAQWLTQWETKVPPPRLF